MAEIAFRDYLPYHLNIEETPLVITSDSPTYTTINQLIISASLPAGQYIMTLSYVWWMADTNDSALFRVISPVTSGEVYKHEPKDASDLVSRTQARPVTHAGGPITITFEGSKTAAAGNLNINWSAVEFERKI